MVSMATKDSIMKQSTFFWVIGHILLFEYSLKEMSFQCVEIFFGALRELILKRR